MRIRAHWTDSAVIESITKHREPQSEFEAMYLLMPTNQNVDRIIRDFSGNTKQYAAGHLFFIEGKLVINFYLYSLSYRADLWRRTCGTVIPAIDIIRCGTTLTSFEGIIHQFLG